MVGVLDKIMSNIKKILKRMETSRKNVTYKELVTVCEHFFGKPAGGKGNHRKYKRRGIVVNIQEYKNGKAKPYQVKQVQRAIENIEAKNEH